jgi:hypothetical protein
MTITELHVGAAADGGQWFELRNVSGAGQNLIEQVFTDGDGDTFQVLLTVIVRDGEHVIFASEDSTADADYRFPAAFDLRAAAGTVHHTDTLGTVDEVRWDEAWGVSGIWQVDPAVAANEWANDLPGSWCAGAGTPGADNVACPGADSDDDGDGFTEQDGDCDDTNPDVHPGAPDGPDIPDDGDCDGTRDDDPPVDTGHDTGADTGTPDTGRDTAADTGAPDTAGDDSGENESARVDSGETGDSAPDEAEPPPIPPDGPGGCEGCAGAAAWLLVLPALLRRRR